MPDDQTNARGPFPPTLEELDRLRVEERERIAAAVEAGRVSAAEAGGDLLPKEVYRRQRTRSDAFGKALESLGIELPERVAEVFGDPSPESREPLGRARERIAHLDAARSAAFVNHAHRQGEQYILRRFILEQLARAPESERPTTEAEREDLERRLHTLESRSRPDPLFPRTFYRGTEPVEPTPEEARKAWRESLAAHCKELDERIRLDPKGLLARELVAIRERIAPRMAAASRLLPPLEEWNCSALYGLNVSGSLIDPSGSDEGNFYRAALAFHWPEVWADWCRENADQVAARAAVSLLQPEVLERFPDIEGQLERELRRVRPGILEAVWKEDPSASGVRNGMVEQASRWIDAVRALPLGAKGKACVDGYEADARTELLQLELDPETPNRWRGLLFYARALANVLLCDLVQQLEDAKAKLEAAELKPPALTLWALERVREARAGDGRVAAVELGVIAARQLASLTYLRLTVWEILTGHRRMYDPAIADPRVLRFADWSELAKQLDIIPAGKALEDLRGTVRAQARLRFPLPGRREGNLITLNAPQGKGQRGDVVITLGDVLLPEFGRIFGKQTTLTARESKRLVPIIKLPPMTIARLLYAAQADLSWELMAELRRRAVELYQHGSVLLAPTRLEQLSRSSGLDPQHLPKVLDRWTRDGATEEEKRLGGAADGPAFLKRVEGGDRWTLGDEHKAARDFLVAAGKLEDDGGKGIPPPRKRAAWAKRGRKGKRGGRPTGPPAAPDPT